MSPKFDTFTLLILSVVVLSGCSGQKYPAGMPPLQPTTVLITQEGKPLAHAVVSAVSSTGSQWSAVGTTDSDGKAKLFVNGQYEGVPIGSFKLLVTKMETEEIAGSVPAEPEPDPRTNRAEWIKWNARKRPPARIPDSFDLVEKIYSDPTKTPLTIEVVKGKNEFTLDAGKAVRIKQNR